VPLGVFITNSQSTATLTKALQMFKDLVGADGFFRSEEGPSIFFTEDRKAEHSAINAVWKKATLQLSLFHILQAMWLWVVTSKRRIPECDQQQECRMCKVHRSV
jgi:hypothetical protein